jgi:xanthine dehydrogenase YagS FAD-binding subunit
MQERKEGECTVLYELPPFEHADAASVAEAVSLLEEFGDSAKVIAGGTDLLGIMKDKLAGPKLSSPKVLINVKPVARMKRVDFDDECGLRIGAAATLHQLEVPGATCNQFPILSQAARRIGTTQIRNMGTVGGNLCQRPQCLYFRHPEFMCYKKGGKHCYAVKSKNGYDCSIMEYGRCVMAHPSDLAPVLIALKAKALIASSLGERKVPLGNFFLGPNSYSETILKPDELLVEIQVPNARSRTHQVFLKHRIRRASDFALASVAVVAESSEGIVKEIGIVMGGVAPFPYRVVEAEEMTKGKMLDTRLISRIVKASLEHARPLPMNSYKVDLAKTMLKRALASISKQTASADYSRDTLFQTR